MAVPYTFGTATASIPLSNLDSNFATTITLGNTAIQLGNTVTTLNNMTLANVAVTSVSTAFPNNLLANSSVTLGNTAVALGSTATTLGNVTLTNATVSSLSTAITVAQGGTGLTSTPANGALDIGNGTGFTRTTLTAGSGVSITNGAGSISIAATNSGITSGTAVATTSGTSIDFTSIPSTVKRITVMFNQISTNGSSVTTIRLGTSGGIESTGYGGSVCTVTGINAGSYARIFSTGFDTSYDQYSAATMSGLYTIVLVGSNTWSASWMIGTSDGSGRAYFGGGFKTLSGTLTTVRLTNTNGTDTFDNGSINILYE
jgi:hypothetical protein